MSKLSPLDQEIADRVYEVVRKTPFTNSAAIRHELGLPLPVDGGDCAYIANKVKEALSDLPGEARVHRARSKGPYGRTGLPGNHVILIKETEGGLRALDPYLLQKAPHPLIEGEGTQESWLVDQKNQPTFIQFSLKGDLLSICKTDAKRSASSLPYDFFVTPKDEVVATGMENALYPFKTQCLRFVFDGGVGKLTFDQMDCKTQWTQGGHRMERKKVEIDGMTPSETRKEIDSLLKEFNLSLEAAQTFLVGTEHLQIQARWD